MMAGVSHRPAAHLTPPGATDQVVVRMRLIGQMEAWTLTSENVLPAGRKTRALLAVIALSSPRPALRGRLAELLWSRRPEEQARASLRQEIHRLHEALAAAGTEVLQVTRDHLSLRSGTVWIDVEEVMRATTEQPTSLSLLDGDLLEDLDGVDPTFDAWLAAERERLRDRGRTVAEALLREQVDPEAAIPAAQRLLQIDRAHEGAWRALMRAHAARGERGMAIQAYDRCRAVLADLLDASPSVETQKLLAGLRRPHSP
jgi:DNA-binding SARP family transcriptional activator